MLEKAKKKFPFLKNDVVLARYGSELYYAKILSINYKRKFAKLLFDDDSKEEVSFKKIYSVNEETSDIICIICKKDRTDSDNDIVLCDSCNVGYHQLCHDPIISSDVLLPEVPWKCVYCERNENNPYVSDNPFEKTDEEMQQQGPPSLTSYTVSHHEEIQSNGKNGFTNTEFPDEFHQKEEIQCVESHEDKMEICGEDKDNNNDTETTDENNNSNNNQQDESYNHVVIAHADSTSNDDCTTIDIVKTSENNGDSPVISDRPHDERQLPSCRATQRNRKNVQIDKSRIDKFLYNENYNDSIHFKDNKQIIQENVVENVHTNDKNINRSITHNHHKLSGESLSPSSRTLHDNVVKSPVDIKHNQQGYTKIHDGEIENLENKMKLQRLDSCIGGLYANNSRNIELKNSHTEYWIKQDKHNSSNDMDFKNSDDFHETKFRFYDSSQDIPPHIPTSPPPKHSLIVSPSVKNYPLETKSTKSNHPSRDVKPRIHTNQTQVHTNENATYDAEYERRQRKPSHKSVQQVATTSEGKRYYRQSHSTNNGKFHPSNRESNHFREHNTLPPHNEHPQKEIIVIDKNLRVSPNPMINTARPISQSSCTMMRADASIRSEQKVLRKPIHPSPRPNHSVQLEKKAEIEHQLSLQRQWIEEHETQRQLYEHVERNEYVRSPPGRELNDQLKMHERVEKPVHGRRNMHVIREECEQRPDEYVISPNAHRIRDYHMGDGKNIFPDQYQMSKVVRPREIVPREIRMERKNSISRVHDDHKNAHHPMNDIEHSTLFHPRDSLYRRVQPVEYKNGLKDPSMVRKSDLQVVNQEGNIYRNREYLNKDRKHHSTIPSPSHTMKHTGQRVVNTEHGNPGSEKLRNSGTNMSSKSVHTNDYHPRDRLHSETTLTNASAKQPNNNAPLKRTTSEPIYNHPASKRPRQLPIASGSSVGRQEPKRPPIYLERSSSANGSVQNRHTLEPSRCVGRERMDYKNMIELDRDIKFDHNIQHRHSEAVFTNEAILEKLSKKPPVNHTGVKSPNNKHACRGCGGDAHFLCSGCRKTWYCTQRCQLADWKKHSITCEKKAI